MPLQAHLANPFALLINAEAVLQEMHGSHSLEQLEHHVYHPLDKVMKARPSTPETDAFDQSVDAMADEPEAADAPEAVHPDDILQLETGTPLPSYPSVRH